LCLDGSRDLDSWELYELEHITPNTIVVVTKSDLGTSIVPDLPAAVPIVVTSSLNLTGFQTLREQLCLTVTESQLGETSVVGSTVLRASESLAQAMQSVELALQASEQNLGEELVAAEIRQALAGLGQVVGTVYTDDILDLVFGRFCIGK